MKKGTLVVTVMSVVWVVAAAALGISSWSQATEPLKPNEVGDFLAGVFSPVAFLWLVLSYRQQGEELRLQGQELANAVAAAQEQNGLLKLDFERRQEQWLRGGQPVFSMSTGIDVRWRDDMIEFELTILNIGSPCTLVRLPSSIFGLRFSPSGHDSIDRLGSFSTHVLMDVPAFPVTEEFFLQYRDAHGVERYQRGFIIAERQTLGSTNNYRVKVEQLRFEPGWTGTPPQ